MIPTLDKTDENLCTYMCQNNVSRVRNIHRGLVYASRSDFVTNIPSCQNKEGLGQGNLSSPPPQKKEFILVVSPSEWGKEKAVTTCKLKNLHSCLVLTSLGTAACGAVALSWPARNTWPAPPAIGRATAK